MTDISNGCYILQDSKIERVYFASDFEGSNVLKKHVNDDTYNTQMDKMLPGLTITDGIITDINDDTVFVYCGDLLDNSNYDVRLLESIVNIKRNKPLNLCFVNGNRDLDKIRLYNECVILDENKKNVIDIFLEKCEHISNTNEKHDEFVNFCIEIAANFGIKYKFSFDVASKLDFNNPERINEIGTLERIKITYARLSAEPILNNRIDEICNMFNVSVFKKLQKNDEHKYAFIALTNMMMLKNYENKGKYVIVDRLNNLLGDFLKNIHLLGYIKFNDKTYLASHSYLPHDGILRIPNKNNTDNKTHLVYDKTTQQGKEIGNVHDAISSLNFSFKNHINTILKDFSDNSIIDVEKNNNLIDYYDYLNDYSKRDLSFDGEQYEKIPNENTNIMNRKYEFKTLYGGNDFYNFYSIKNGGNIDYFIFGHTPQGHVPVIENCKKCGTATTYICLDVSKSDGFPIAQYTFSLLSAEKNTEYLCGRIHLNERNLHYESTNNNSNKMNIPNNVFFYYKYDIKEINTTDLFKKKNNNESNMTKFSQCWTTFHKDLKITENKEIDETADGFEYSYCKYPIDYYGKSYIITHYSTGFVDNCIFDNYLVFKQESIPLVNYLHNQQRGGYLQKYMKYKAKYIKLTKQQQQH